MGKKSDMQLTVLGMFEQVNDSLVDKSEIGHVTVPLNLQKDKKELPDKDPEWLKLMADPQIQHLIDSVGILPRGRIFSGFNNTHVDEATRVIKLLTLSSKEESLLKSAMKAVKAKINEEMFVYVMSIFILHKLPGVEIPPIEEVVPQKFIPAEFIKQAINRENTLPADYAEPIVLSADFTGNDLDLEHRVAYYREDIGLNSHHWHWHNVYPTWWTPELGGMKDRKGELFYYMHHQMIARYDCERLSNNLARVIPYHNFREPIPEGYAPHLGKDTSGTVYASRHANEILKDLPTMTVHRLRTWYNRIMDSVHQGLYIQADGKRVPFDEHTGTDKLGQIVESAIIGPNLNYYGSLHGQGHLLFSRIHDPDDRYKEESGVMGDEATAVRDPIFFRWHKFIDIIFIEWLDSLKPYNVQQLTWNDVTVDDASVQGLKTKEQDSLATYWEYGQFELQRGINFNRPNVVSIRIRHLQHEPFSYKIEVQNKKTSDLTGTVRIFMAPTVDEVGRDYMLEEQRHLYMEMDKFEATLKPGKNTITRKSSDSNVTVAPSKSFTQLFKEAKEGDGTVSQKTSSCLCGLPDHLLIPRGKPEGMKYDLFVMITNSLEDRASKEPTNQCADAASYCGIFNEQYPDRKPMGYPFDRKMDDALNLKVTKLPNTVFKTVKIYFRDEVYSEKPEDITPVESLL